MFSKLIVAVAVAVASFAIFAAANSPDSCSTGSLQCCDSSGEAGSAAVAPILKSIGVVVQDVTALVGVTCSPITVIGASSSGCSSETLCCDDTSFKGLVALGCTPINIDL